MSPTPKQPMTDDSIKVRQVSHYQFSWVAGGAGKPGTWTLQLVLDQGAWEEVLTLDGQQVGRVRTADASARRLLVKHLDNGRTYRLRMKAKNEAGGSAWTAPMRFRPSRH